MQDLHKYKWLLPVLVLFNSSAIRAMPLPLQEEDYQTILITIRDHRFSEARQHLNTLLNPPESPGETEKLILSELVIYNEMLQEFGAYKNKPKVSLNRFKNNTNPTYRALYYLNSGLYKLLYEYNEEVTAMENLHEALYIAIEAENNVLVCEIIKAILLYYDKLTNIIDYGYKYYLSIYEKNTYDITERDTYWVLNISLKLSMDEPIIPSKDNIPYLEQIKEEIKHPYYKAYLYKTLGIYYDKDIKDHKKAYTYFNKAATYFKDINIVGEQAALTGAAVALYNQKRYQEAITMLKQSKPEDYKGKSMQWNAIFYHARLAEFYAGAGDMTEAYYNSKTRNELKNKFDQIRHNLAQLTIKKNTAILKEKLRNSEAKNNTLHNRLLILIPILGIITIILILTYYLFKRYKKKSVVLETEKSETLKKLDELKNIVIKNHIVLKDRTKVYIADLLYIKSEGHYLNIFLSDGKNHFVRGKLSQIKEELPPNFIQCHRSYIVNTNFIKQINSNSITLINKERIPLSRGYKNKF